jgi:selenocysteine-specific elongation factor
VIQALDGRAGSSLAEVIEKSGLPAEQVRALVVRLVDDAAVVALGERYRTAATIAALQETVEQELAQFHQRYPLRSGISREELRSRLHLPARDAAALLDHLAAQGVLVLDEAIARLASHQVTLSADQEERARRLVDDLDAQPFAPRSLDVLCQQYGIDAELLAALVARGAIVRVSEDIAFTASAFASLRQRILDHLGTAGAITVAEVRTMLDTSRKYALALMEYFDQQRLTRRVGDTRVLR